MSLMRRIWLLVVSAVLLSLLGSVAVTTVLVRDALQAQWQMKNNDNAAALALAMSQQGGDEALMALLVSAQFDTGYYERVVWRRADGSVAFSREAPGKPSSAPQWFVALTPIDPSVGLAQVSSGWRAAGQVEVRSQSGYVHDALWRNLWRSAVWQALVGTLAGMLALWVLRRIQRPLEAAIAQAEAVSHGEFTRIEEPRIPELRRFVQAMNKMVGHLQTQFEAQGQHLRTLQSQAHDDALTGLATRKHFIAELSSCLAHDDAPVRAGLVLLRLHDLPGLNQRLGREGADVLLRQCGQLLLNAQQEVPGALAGRLNGTDMALWLPLAGLAGPTAQALAQALREAMAAQQPPVEVALASVELPRERALTQWFSEADLLLARAEQQGGIAVAAAEETPPEALAHGERAWHGLIEAAVSHSASRLLEFPLLGPAGAVQHLECPLQLRLTPGGDFLGASIWLPLALRTRLSAQADLHAATLALAQCAADGQMRCINMAPASLLEGDFLPRLRALLDAAPAAARRLGIEVAEAAAVQQFDRLQEFGRQIRPYGTQLGLEHAGRGLTRIERLYQAGLDYIKLDAAVVSGVAGDAGRAAYVRSLVVMLRSLSLSVYAEGVVDPRDAETLWACGVQGITGPWATLQHQTPG